MQMRRAHGTLMCSRQSPFGMVATRSPKGKRMSPTVYFLVIASYAHPAGRQPLVVQPRVRA